MQEIDVRRTIDAPAAVVGRLLDDSSTWPEWTAIDDYALERAPGEDGLGEIRVFRTGRVTVREEVVRRAGERGMSYRLLDGLAVRDYRADVDVEPAGPDRCAVRWRTTFRAARPWMGPVYRFALGTATKRFVAGLAERAGAEA